MPEGKPNVNDGPIPAGRKTSTVLPSGYSWLNIPVPKELHTHLHHMARLSNMSLRAYVGLFLRTATTISVDVAPESLQREATANEQLAHEELGEKDPSFFDCKKPNSNKESQ